MEVLLKMTEITLYPIWNPNNNTGMLNIDGNAGKYREMEEIQLLGYDDARCGHWGNENPGTNFEYAVSSRDGGRYYPSAIEVSNFDFSSIPNTAKITGFRVNYAYAKFAYPNMGHGSFGNPLIMIAKFHLSKVGNAPPRDVITPYSVSFDGLDLRKTDLENLKVRFFMRENSSEYPAYVKMQYLTLTVEYDMPVYIHSISVSNDTLRYGDESTVTVEVVDIHKIDAVDDVMLSFDAPPSLEIVQGSVVCDGTLTQRDNLPRIWYAKIKNGRAKLTFKVRLSSYDTGRNSLYVYRSGRTAVQNFYFVPVQAYASCSVSSNVIMQSLQSEHLAYFALNIWNPARSPVEVYIDFDKLKYYAPDYFLDNYDPETKILTITEWDDNDIFDVEISFYSTEFSDSEIIVYSDNWEGITNIKIEVNEEFDYDEFYTELDALPSTLGSMKGTDGEYYVFGCLCRITDTNEIIRGMKNVRASVVNGSEYFTNKLSQIGDWQLLTVKFRYSEANKLSFRFYGNYIEVNSGTISFGNLFLIHYDFYTGYEYPALAFDETEYLIQDDEYANLLLEPPEKNPCTKHYFDMIDWQGLSESKYLVVHGLEVTGKIYAEENSSVLMGFGHQGIDEMDYFTTSINVTPGDNTFKFGGKFETFGFSFSDIEEFLDSICFYFVVDDIFDNHTPINVQMKNVQITLYFSLDNACWEFFINGTSSKHFLLDLMADSEIPRGAAYDVNKFKIDGADGEYPNRINLEENKLKLKFTTCECGTIEDLSVLLEKVVEWLYPERDSLDNPILKTISFFYAPDRGYDYYIEDTMEAEAVDGGYDCEVELIVPDGLAHNIEQTSGSSIGTTGHMGKIRPIIHFNILSHEGDIIIIENQTMQKFTLTGEYIDNIPLDSEFILDCRKRKLYRIQFGEKYDVDPNCITMDSDFFVISGHYDFTSSINCKVSQVIYKEWRG